MSDSDNLYISKIETLWPVVHRAHNGQPDEEAAAKQLLLDRYRPAIYRYLRACLDEGGADEVLSDFSYRFLRGDFRNADPKKGRFRDLLKSALYRMILDHNKKRQRAPRQLADNYAEPVASEESTLASDREFLRQWRASLMAKAWEKLEQEEQRSKRPMHTVLKFRADNSEMRSPQMAEELSLLLSKSVTAEWVRKWLSEARDQFAIFLLEEVAASLGGNPTKEQVEQELLDLEIYQYCKSGLDDWQP